MWPHSLFKVTFTRCGFSQLSLSIRGSGLLNKLVWFDLIDQWKIYREARFFSSVERRSKLQRQSFHDNTRDLPPKKMCKIAGIWCGAAIFTCTRSWLKFPGILYGLFLWGSTQEATVTTRVLEKTARRVEAACCFPPTLFCSLSANMVVFCR